MVECGEEPALAVSKYRRISTCGSYRKFSVWYPILLMLPSFNQIIVFSTCLRTSSCTYPCLWMSLYTHGYLSTGWRSRPGLMIYYCKYPHIRVALRWSFHHASSCFHPSHRPRPGPQRGKEKRAQQAILVMIMEHLSITTTTTTTTSFCSHSPSSSYCSHFVVFLSARALSDVVISGRSNRPRSCTVQ